MEADVTPDTAAALTCNFNSTTMGNHRGTTVVTRADRTTKAATTISMMNLGALVDLSHKWVPQVVVRTRGL